MFFLYHESVIFDGNLLSVNLNISTNGKFYYYESNDSAKVRRHPHLDSGKSEKEAGQMASLNLYRIVDDYSSK